MKKSIIFIVLTCFFMSQLPVFAQQAGTVFKRSSTLSALFDPFCLVNNASQDDVPLTSQYRVPPKSGHDPVENTALIQEFSSLVRMTSQVGSAYNSSKFCLWNLFALSDPSPPNTPWSVDNGGLCLILLAYIVLLHRSNLPWRIMNAQASVSYVPTLRLTQGRVFL